MKRMKLVVLWIIVAALASACGGGGGGRDADADGDDGQTDAEADAEGTEADGGDAAEDPSADDASDGDADAPDLPDDVTIDHYHPECVELPSTQVIALWDVVPMQVLSSPAKLGVVGFHELGLDVVFSVNGTEVARAADPEYNDLTGAYEYWFTFDPSAYPDGPVTVTATAEPDCPGHTARQLADLVLNANAGGTLTNDAVRWADCAAGSDVSGVGSEASPYGTIERAYVEVGAGGTVHLKAGDCYSLTDLYPEAGYDLWTTVRPAPGLGRDDVAILAYGPTEDSTGRFGENMVRWKDVRIYKDVEPGFSSIFYFESGHNAWVDGTELYDARGMWNGGQITNGNDPYRVYYTDAFIRDIQNVMVSFARNVAMENIGSDVFRGTSDLLAVNVTVVTIDSGTTDAHPDFIQFYNPDSTVDNVILYNARVLNMGAQGIFGGEGAMRNIAFVNLLMEKDPPDSFLISQLTGDWDHLLMWHITTVDSGMMLREPENIRNAWVIDGIYATLSSGSATELPGWTIDHNRAAELTWEQTEPMGTSASVGDPVYMDVGADDYRLGAGSPAADAGIPLPGVPADADGVLYDRETPSLGAFSAP